jgi:hypothetical protein
MNSAVVAAQYSQEIATKTANLVTFGAGAQENSVTTNVYEGAQELKQLNK